MLPFFCTSTGVLTESAGPLKLPLACLVAPVLVAPPLLGLDALSAEEGTGEDGGGAGEGVTVTSILAVCDTGS